MAKHMDAEVIAVSDHGVLQPLHYKLRTQRMQLRTQVEIFLKNL